MANNWRPRHPVRKWCARSKNHPNGAAPVEPGRNLCTACIRTDAPSLTAPRASVSPYSRNKGDGYDHFEEDGDWMKYQERDRD